MGRSIGSFKPGPNDNWCLRYLLAPVCFLVPMLVGAQSSPPDALVECAKVESQEECVRFAVIQNPEDTKLGRCYINLLIRAGENDLALAETRRLQQLCPEDPDLVSTEAQILRLSGEETLAQDREARASFLRERRWMDLIKDPDLDREILVREAYSADIVWNELGVSRKLYERYFASCSDPRPRDLRRYASLLAALGDYEASLSIMSRALEITEEEDLETRAFLLKHRAAIRKAAGDVEGMASDEVAYRRIVEEITQRSVLAVASDDGQEH